MVMGTMGLCRKDITKSGLRSSPHTERHEWTSCNWKVVLVGALSKRRVKIDCNPSLSPSSFSGRPVLTATCSQSLSSHLTSGADGDNAIFVFCLLAFWPSSCRVVLVRRGGLAIIALTSSLIIQARFSLHHIKSNCFKLLSMTEVIADKGAHLLTSMWVQVR